MFRIRIAVAPVLVALVLSACGGGGGERLSKAEYTKKVNAICEKGQADIEKATSSLSEISGEDPGDVDKIKKALDTSFGIVERSQKEIEKLKPPAADDDEVNAINKELDEAIAAGREQTKDIESIEDLQAIEADPFEDYNGKAKAYGLTACAQD